MEKKLPKCLFFVTLKNQQQKILSYYKCTLDCYITEIENILMKHKLTFSPKSH